jgi:hypothetical protein
MCLFKSTELSYLEKTEPISALKIKVAGSIPFKNYHKSHRETLCYSLLILTQMDFFSRDTCVFQLSCICLFGTKRAYFPFENSKLHEEFLSKTM